MIARLFLALALCLGGVRADAWLIGNSAVPYVGPGDIVSGASMFVGHKAYSAAVAATGTQQAFTYKRSSDSATCTSLIGTNGDEDLTVGTPCSSNTQTVTAWAGVDTITVVTGFDQSGHSQDLATACAGNTKPTLGFSVFGANPGTVHLTSQCLFSGPAVTSQPLTASMVAKRTGNVANADIMVGGTDFHFQVAFSTTNLEYMYAGSGPVNGPSATDGVAHAYQFVFNGSSSVANVDNSTTTGNAGTGGFNSATAVGGFAGGGNNADMDWGEMGVWPVAFTPTQQTNMCHNQFGRWGTGVSC